jgi:dCMP deaminase
MSRLWDARFLDLAAKIAGWSKDPSTRCGAVIVDPQRRIVSTGYNGLSAGVDDDPAMLANRDTKLALTLHAEHNAILFAQRDLSGCTLYVWPMPPCAHCAAQIAQVGIARVVSGRPTPEQGDRWGESFRLAQWVFGQRGIAYEAV